MQGFGIMFDIRDKDGWTGVSAEGLANARYACETIVAEGDFQTPLEIVPEGAHYAVETMHHDEHGAVVWRHDDTIRKYDGRAA